jgi:hypothetical protein
LIYVAQRAGHVDLAGSWLRRFEGDSANSQNQLVAKMTLVVRANQLRLEGKSEEAGELLRPQLDGSELVQAHVVMREIERAKGSEVGVGEHERWLRANRGRALAEVAASQVMQTLNVAETFGAIGERDRASSR